MNTHLGDPCTKCYFYVNKKCQAGERNGYFPCTPPPEWYIDEYLPEFREIERELSRQFEE